MWHVEAPTHLQVSQEHGHLLTGQLHASLSELGVQGAPASIQVKEANEGLVGDCDWKLRLQRQRPRPQGRLQWRQL